MFITSILLRLPIRLSLFLKFSIVKFFMTPKAELTLWSEEHISRISMSALDWLSSAYSNFNGYIREFLKSLWALHWLALTRKTTQIRKIAFLIAFTPYSKKERFYLLPRFHSTRVVYVSFLFVNDCNKRTSPYTMLRINGLCSELKIANIKCIKPQNAINRGGVSERAKSSLFNAFKLFENSLYSLALAIKCENFIKDSSIDFTAHFDAKARKLLFPCCEPFKFKLTFPRAWSVWNYI